LEDDFGYWVQSLNHLATLSTSHFSGLYKAPQETTLAEIIKVAGVFPRFVNHEAAEDLIKQISMGELEGTLK